MTETGIIVLMAFVGLFVLWFFWVRLPAQMARNRGRSALGWVLLTWVLSPLWSIILLLIVGDSDEKIVENMINRMK